MSGSRMPELLRRPAGELARMVRAGEVSSRELVEASLARIEATSGLGHWTLVDAEGALAAAGAVRAGDERPFAGVPIAIKDLFAAVAGLRMSQGSVLVGDWAPDYDFGVVARLKRAGFVIVGKTSTPEFGILPVTEPRRFGPARNPWDPERTTGGSSGGAAGAVAGGCVPVAHGSDGGGSIRIPAACCGLVGLKPSRGRVSMAPELGEHFLNQHGVVARTSADAAAMLDLIAGPEPGDASWAPPPPEPFAATAAREPGPLRIALVLEGPIEAELDPLAERGVRDAAGLLEELGHRVEEIEAPWRNSGMLGTFTVLWSASVALSAFHAQAVAGREAREEDLEPLTWWLRRQGEDHGATGYLLALATLQAFARGVVSLWERFDLVLTPALAKRPVAHGEIDACGEDPAVEFARSSEFTPYTSLFNVTGQPAVSVPLFHGEDGLPLGVQLAGPPLGEGLLLQVCGQLERARPWAQRMPPEAG